MNILKILLLTLFITGACTSNRSTNDTALFNELKEQYDSNDYFKFRSNLERNGNSLSPIHHDYYMALMYHVFNQQEEAIRYADKVLDMNNTTVSDSLIHQLYRIKRMSHINQYEYAKAVIDSDEIINNYSVYEDSVDLVNVKNERKIWEALADVPKQKISKNSDVLIKMQRDKVGLMNINCNFNDDTIPFLFDTGANFSVITRSLAERLELDIIETDFFVTAATGEKVNSSLAIARDFNIEGIRIQNAIFLMFEDKDISFPQIDYYPNGAIGFPIIEAFNEIHINGNHSIYIPETETNYSLNNLALDGLLPVIEVKYKADTLNFNFDTGANATTLYHTFYSKYQKEIDNVYNPELFTSGSGGGLKEFEGFILDSLTFSVDENSAEIYNIRLHKDIVYDDTETMYGNFGQDYIKSFDRMIISFKYSSLYFK